MESYSSVFEELHEHRFLKNELIQQILYGTYYSQIYIDTVIQNVIGRLSLTIFIKISTGKIDAIIYAQALLKDGKISEDIYLLFDEMYLQNCEEHFGGEQIGSYENGELYEQTHNQEFFRGEFSSNQSTSINISQQYQKERPHKEKSPVFSPGNS